MASLNSSCFGLLQFTSSTFKKLSSESIKSACFSAEFGCFVDECNNLTRVLLPSVEYSFLSTNVVQVSCCENVAGFVTSYGFLFTMGEDEGKSGILGVKNCFSAKSPCRVMVNVKIETVSVGFRHAAAVSAKGELFTWGSGKVWELGNCAYGERVLPAVVQTAKIFLIKQAVCGKNLTAFCTAGGFVYIYGELPLNSCEKSEITRNPYTIKGMTDYFITKAEVSETFLLLQSDQKEVLILDACMKINKLPQKYSRVACSPTSIIGISKSDKIIHELRIKPEAHCKASSFSESAYFVDEVFSHKFQLFSGFFVSCGFSSANKPISHINLQQLSLQKLFIDHSDVKIESPDLGTKKYVGRVFAILGSQVRSLLKGCLFDLKIFAKCRKMVVEKPLEIILATVVRKVMVKGLILKRAAWRRFGEFVEDSKRKCELKVLKRAQGLQNFLVRVSRRVFVFILNTFELQEYWKNHQNHIAEMIFSLLSQKHIETKRQSYYSIKKFANSIKSIKRRLNRLFHLVTKGIKLKFIDLLVQNHIIKLKIYKIITQIISYSAAQNSRVRILNFFHKWKRSLVSLKIARISEKYLKSMKTKKLADKLMQLHRKTLKSTFSCIKLSVRSNPHRFKIIFLSNSLKLLLCPIVKPAFYQLKTFKTLSKQVNLLLNTLVKNRFSSIILAIKSFMSTRKYILLLKILTKKLTKSANNEHRQVFKAFIKLSSFFIPKCSSPSSPSQFSKTMLIRSRISNPNLSICTSLNMRKSEGMAKSKTTKLLKEGQKSKLRIENFSKIGKGKQPDKEKKTVKVNKKMSRSPTLVLQKGRLSDEINSTFFSNFAETPTMKSSFEHSPKKESRWEQHIQALGIAIISSLLKSHLKSYTLHLLH